MHKTQQRRLYFIIYCCHENLWNMMYVLKLVVSWWHREKWNMLLKEHWECNIRFFASSFCQRYFMAFILLNLFHINTIQWEWKANQKWDFLWIFAAWVCEVFICPFVTDMLYFNFHEVSIYVLKIYHDKLSILISRIIRMFHTKTKALKSKFLINLLLIGI